MISSIIAFLGGSAFRFITGHLIGWLEKKQAHLQEIERIREQEKIDQAKHQRQQELIKLQSDLKVQEIKLVGETQIGLEEAKAFTEAMKVANRPTGNPFIDAWNGAIRPAAASVAIALWVCKIAKAGFTAWDQDLVASILGYYFADRQLGKRK